MLDRYRVIGGNKSSLMVKTVTFKRRNLTNAWCLLIYISTVLYIDCSITLEQPTDIDHSRCSSKREHC